MRVSSGGWAHTTTIPGTTLSLVLIGAGGLVGLRAYTNVCVCERIIHTLPSVPFGRPPEISVKYITGGWGGSVSPFFSVPTRFPFRRFIVAYTATDLLTGGQTAFRSVFFKCSRLVFYGHPNVTRARRYGRSAVVFRSDVCARFEVFGDETAR